MTLFQKIHYSVKLSVFLLFPVVTKPPYEITETGWGEFEIIIKIFFIDPNERPVRANTNSYLAVSEKAERSVVQLSSPLPYNKVQGLNPPYRWTRMKGF